MDATNRARRRLRNLTRHVEPIPSTQEEDNAWKRASLSQLACSAGSREGFQRRDNRTLFARQSSDSHGQFMRQFQAKQDSYGEGRESARLESLSAPGPGGGNKSCKDTQDPSDDGSEPSFAVVEPLFGKPAPEMDPVEKQATDVPGQKQEPKMPALSQERESSSQGSSTSEGTRPAHVTPADGEAVKKVSPAAKDQTVVKCFGFEWFPRMDVVESGAAYVVTIELPGVSTDGIRVEVNRGSLIVTGSRATDWWKANNNGSNGGGTVYHRRELAQGPYRALWRLPKNGDINGITAEFIDGFLRVLVPKIKIMSYR